MAALIKVIDLFRQSSVQQTLQLETLQTMDTRRESTKGMKSMDTRRESTKGMQSMDTKEVQRV